MEHFRHYLNQTGLFWGQTERPRALCQSE